MAKTITGSVGQGGINNSKDTMTIQYLLNCVPASKGGPTTELEVDGIVGPKTIAAIKNFQKANSPFSDGRVDAGKATLQALQKFDPSPAAPMMGSGGKGAPSESKAGPSAKGPFGGAKGAGGAGGAAGAAAGKAAGAGPGAGAKGAGGGSAAPGAGGYGGKGVDAAQLGGAKGAGGGASAPGAGKVAGGGAKAGGKGF